jgi:hypothetical protein
MTMAERDTVWPPGTPCWADLMTTDLPAARLFYEGAFAWHFGESPAEAGGYLNAQLNDRSVAGLGPLPEGMSVDVPSWTTYLATTDARATADQIAAAGGTVFSPPMDVMGLGVMALATDPTGGTFGLWEGHLHTGFQLSNQAGVDAWNELMTHDYEAAKDFYATVFGYTYTEIGGGDFKYSTAEVGGQTVGGIGLMPDGSDEVPAHWRLYFAVDDADASVNEIVRLGGSVISPPQDMPYGRHADVADGQGAVFAVIKPAMPVDA